MKRNFISLLVIVMTFASLSICLSAEVSAQKGETGIEISYIVVPKEDYLEVEATLTNNKEEKIRVIFVDSHVGINNLASRIVNLKANTHNGRLLDVDRKDNEFLVNTKHENEFVLSYQIHPNAVQHDYHLVTLTPTYMHIPGDNFAIQLYDEQYNELTISTSFKIKLVDLPQDWEVLHTYALSEDGFIVSDDYYQALIYAGKYEKHSLFIGDNEFIIAVDTTCKFDVKSLIGEIKAIIEYQYQTFGELPSPRILIVINQSRNEKAFQISSGGQGKKYNIINEFGGINKGNQKLYKIKILAHLVHESFHLWMPGDFNTTDNWSWFWEGCADYQAYRVLKNTGIITEKEFENHFKYDTYAAYYSNPYKDEVSLMEISTQKGDFSEYSRLLYDKGAVVAYLFDEELQKKNSNIDVFFASLYETYAITKKPLGNDELIKMMDDALGETTFTSQYILGTEPLPLNTPQWVTYYYLIKHYLPPLAFPWDILVTIIVSTFLLLIVVGLIIKGVKILCDRK